MTRLRAKATKSNKPFCFDDEMMDKNGVFVFDEMTKGWVEIEDHIYRMKIQIGNNIYEQKVAKINNDIGYLHLVYFTCFEALKDAQNGDLGKFIEKAA